MEPTLLRYIWRHSRRQQIVILIVTAASFPLLYYSLELPKLIVNDALQGEGFPRDVFGRSVGQVPYLLTLCFIFLALVIINNAIKYVLNVYKGLLGERMLRRLRYDLYQRVLRFRLPRFRQVSQGEIIPMVTSEVEPLGGFIGDAIALPALQGGTLFVYLYFIFAQDFWLGLAAIALYPLQMWIIPKLQARVNRLSRERVINIRHFANRVGESISGVREIHANDTSAWHLAEISDRLHHNFDIRYRGFRLRFLIKFLNNFINQLTPFFFYSIGGYLVITGDISFGALVAVLAAYKDLAGPWKELLAFYQERADVEIKYRAVVDNFNPPDLVPVERLVSDRPGVALRGEVRLEGVSVDDGSDTRLRDVNLEIPEGAKVLVLGAEADGRSALLDLLARLREPTAGRVIVGGEDLADVPEATVGRTVAYAGPGAFVFTETVRGNLFYGLRHRPLEVPGKLPAEARKRIDEAQITGNSGHLLSVPWEDPAEGGATDRHGLDTRALEALDAVGLTEAVFRFGLSARIDPAAEAAPIAELVLARRRVAERLAADPGAADLVELWDISRMNNSASVAENLLFAMPSDPATHVEDLPADPLVEAFLADSGLDAELVEMGREAAAAMIDLFAQVSADSRTLESFSLISAEEIPLYEVVVRKLEAKGASKLKTAERRMLIGLAMSLVPARHRLGIVTEARAARLVAARTEFHALVAARGNNRFVPFDPEAYAPPLSIEDNLIFGKTRLDRRGPRERIDAIIVDVIAELGLEPQIRRAGLDYHVGVAGSKLSGWQRERLAFARVIMRRTPVAIVDGIDEPALREVLLRPLEQGRTVIVGGTADGETDGFDMIVRLREGRIVSEALPTPAESGMETVK